MIRNLLLTLIIAISAPAFPAEDDLPPPPTNRPDPAALRNRMRNFTPEEREARLKDLRSRFGATNRSEMEKRREELRKLSPAERAARTRQWREQNLNSNSPMFNRLTPAERETKRTEFKARVENQIKTLESRQAIAPLSAVEQRRLERFREMSRRLDQGTALGSPRRNGANRPTRPAIEPKP